VVAGLGATSLPGVGVGTLAVLAGLLTDIAVTAVLLRLLHRTTRRTMRDAAPERGDSSQPAL
jgi:hypothetical protein